MRVSESVRKFIPVRLSDQGTCPLGNKGETKNKIHGDTDLTKHGDNDIKWTSPVTLTDGLPRQAPLPGRSTWILQLIRLNQGRLWLRGVGEWMELNRPIRDVQGEAEQGGTKWGVDRKGSVHLSGWALCLITCPIILLILFLMISLHNLTLYPTCMCTTRVKCQLLVTPAGAWVKTGGSYWSQSRGVGAPGPKNSYWVGQVGVRWVRVLVTMAAAWPQVTAHAPIAGVWQLSVSSPILGGGVCAPVFAGKLEAGPVGITSRPG